MKKKTVFITGSSHGIGRAAALRFAKEGYHVVINGRKDSPSLSSLKKEIEGYMVRCLSCPGDISNPNTVDQVFDQIENEFGNLDILINNAGISYIGLLTDMKLEEWEQLLGTNLSSLFYTCRRAIPAMLHAGGGTILNTSSVWGLHGASCETAYSASKGGVNAFTMALARELAPSHINVNAIAFGAVDTEMNQFLTPEERTALIEEIPACRLVSPEEAADFMLRIAESERYLTGQIIPFDGGWC